MISDGCLAHKTAVALAALSQYIRFIVSSTTAADRHLLGINFLVEPYRLPQQTTVPATRSSHLDHVVGRPAEPRQKIRQPSDGTKDSKNAAADDAEIDVAEVRRILSNRDAAGGGNGLKFVGGGDSHQDADYDDNTEVELDKDDVKPARSWEFRSESELRPDDTITSRSLVDDAVPRLAAAALAGPKRSHPGGVRLLFTSHWFLLVVAVFLLMFWLRCLRCCRCRFIAWLFR